MILVVILEVAIHFLVSASLAKHLDGRAHGAHEESTIDEAFQALSTLVLESFLLLSLGKHELFFNDAPLYSECHPSEAEPFYGLQELGEAFDFFTLGDELDLDRKGPLRITLHVVVSLINVVDAP